MQYKFEYAKPSSINAVGSYPLKLVTRNDSQLCIDLAVTIPAVSCPCKCHGRGQWTNRLQGILQEKDYLNYRYFYKRAYYIAHIATGIKDAGAQDFQLSFENLNGNQLQPILVVKQAGGEFSCGPSCSHH